MATNNAINASSQGTLYNNGTGTISGIDGGTSGHVLTSNGTGVAPSFQASGGGGSGSIVAQKRTTSSTAAAISTVLALTGTTPTTSNTTSIITQSYTPTNSSNVLIFDFSCPFSAASLAATFTMGFFLFSGSTFISAFPFFVTAITTEAFTSNFRYYQVAGTTSATTYAVYGAVSTTSNSVNLLAATSGTAFYGGTGGTNIMFMITEVTP